MTLESKGTTINIKKNMIANVSLSNRRATILKSPDNMITIEIPEDANPTHSYLAIELIEHEGLVSGEKSDVYKVTPSGIMFQNPVTIHMHFVKKNGECPTSLTYYQESNDEEHLTTQSFKIDCESSTAFFKINRFI